MASGVRLTMNTFKNRLLNINPNIEVISREYKNMKTPLIVRCNICNNEWEAKPQHLLRGHGCVECYRKRNMLSNDEFMSRINENVIVLNKYKGYDSIIKCRCKECDYEWETMAQNLICKHGCPKCGINRLSENDFKRRLCQSYTDLELTGKYFGMAKATTFRCLRCGHMYETTPSNALRHGCRKCYNRNRTMSLDDFIYRLKHINKNISYISGFKDSNSRIKVRCLKCNYIWETRSYNLLGYTGCPNCKKSHGEDTIKNFLDENKIEYQWQKKFDDLYGDYNRKLSYDFYLPKYNLLIEYQGKQHYAPIELFGGEEGLKIRIKYDDKKRMYAENHSIDLLEISYKDDIEEKLKKYFKTKSRND